MRSRLYIGTVPWCGAVRQGCVSFVSSLEFVRCDFPSETGFSLEPDSQIRYQVVMEITPLS